MKWTRTVAQEDRQSIDLWCEDARNILLRRKLRRNREADIKMDRTEVGRKRELEQRKGHVPCR